MTLVVQIAWGTAVLIAWTLIAGCDIVDVSMRSEKLEKDVAPHIVRWSATDQPVLKLFELDVIRESDVVCLVPEYNCLSGIKNSDVVTNVVKYHSSFGKCVPENRIGLVIVSENVTHAALLKKTRALSNTLSFATCVRAESAVLRRSFDPNYSAPSLIIEGE